MNCLIILLLLACGGCQNRSGCGCGGSSGGCIEPRGSERCPGAPQRDECDCRQGSPAAWGEGREGREGRHNSYPSISSDEPCGCDAQ